MKKLCKSKDKKICGVCAGFAEYFGIDTTLVRLLWALAVVCCGVGLLAYIVCAIVLPKAQDNDNADSNNNDDNADNDNDDDTTIVE